mmetsp:Transcript_13179/g.38058  ORF Transcript_13179/g.38058 Transcript_13179/m.38058 type:complete len:128 (+) Transcript_13179:58-441(+)
MAKSIRSKCKRKARSEFRNTIGTAAWNKTAEHIQKKMQENIGKQSMESLERISSIFEQSQETNEMVVTTATATEKIVPAKGENKIPVKKSQRRKKNRNKGNNSTKKQQTNDAAKPAEKRRPKYFCQF